MPECLPSCTDERSAAQPMADLHHHRKSVSPTTYEGVVTCPQCQKRKQKPFASYLGVTPSLRVKCGCGAVFPILLDVRGYYRKRT